MMPVLDPRKGDEMTTAHDEHPEVNQMTAVGIRLNHTVRRIHCCGCSGVVDARLTDGVEIYPHRTDLQSLPFWVCDACRNFVGCHHKTQNRIAPLGCIPTPELKDARKQLHALIDPIWRSGKMKRRELYAAIGRDLGLEYHTADIRTMDEARAVYRTARKYA